MTSIRSFNQRAEFRLKAWIWQNEPEEYHRNRITNYFDDSESKGTDIFDIESLNEETPS